MAQAGQAAGLAVHPMIAASHEEMAVEATLVHAHTLAVVLDRSPKTGRRTESPGALVRGSSISMEAVAVVEDA